MSKLLCNFRIRGAMLQKDDKAKAFYYKSLYKFNQSKTKTLAFTKSKI